MQKGIWLNEVAIGKELIIEHKEDIKAIFV